MDFLDDFLDIEDSLTVIRFLGPARLTCYGLPCNTIHIRIWCAVRHSTEISRKCGKKTLIMRFELPQMLELE